MAGPCLLIFICTAFVFSIAAAVAAVPPKDVQPGVVYFNTAKYSQGSVYEQNLNKLLDILLMSTPLDVYKNASYGEYPDEVYGISACFKTSFDNCRQCLKSNRDTFMRTAPNAVGGVLYNNGTNNTCYFHYENYRIDGFVFAPAAAPAPPRQAPEKQVPPPAQAPFTKGKGGPATWIIVGSVVSGAILVCYGCILLYSLFCKKRKKMIRLQYQSIMI